MYFPLALSISSDESFSKIQINAETTEMEVWGKNQQFTKVKWNCPRSSWDAEFVLEGRRALNKEDPAFAALVDSIYVELVPLNQ